MKIGWAKQNTSGDPEIRFGLSCHLLDDLPGSFWLQASVILPSTHAVSNPFLLIG